MNLTRLPASMLLALPVIAYQMEAVGAPITGAGDCTAAVRNPGLYFANTTDRPLFLALGYLASPPPAENGGQAEGATSAGGLTWTSTGWYQIDAKGWVRVTERPNQWEYYYYAQDNTARLRWDDPLGQHALCIQAKSWIPFECDLKKLQKDQLAVGFKKVDLRTGAGAMQRVIQLPETFCLTLCETPNCK